jgi:hypothetical protein
MQGTVVPRGIVPLRLNFPERISLLRPRGNPLYSQIKAKGLDVIDESYLAHVRHPNNPSGRYGGTQGSPRRRATRSLIAASVNQNKRRPIVTRILVRSVNAPVSLVNACPEGARLIAHRNTTAAGMSYLCRTPPLWQPLLTASY